MKCFSACNLDPNNIIGDKNRKWVSVITPLQHTISQLCLKISLHSSSLVVTLSVKHPFSLWENVEDNSSLIWRSSDRSGARTSNRVGAWKGGAVTRLFWKKEKCNLIQKLMQKGFRAPDEIRTHHVNLRDLSDVLATVLETGERNLNGWCCLTL